MIVFIIDFANNIIPTKINNQFNNISKDKNFINNYTVKNEKGRIAILLETTSQIFKQYDYHSYISGDATGKKINLEMYLISEMQCYKIKSYCYEHTNIENLKFLGYYYNKFIEKNEKYNLAIYVPENDILYVTDIQID